MIANLVTRIAIAYHTLSEPFMSLPAGARYLAVATFGLIAGSFLTVVVHRLPIMLERAWQRELRALGSPLSATAGNAALPPEPYNLCVPRSACPTCGHQLRLWEIMPLFGFVLLRGRCSICCSRIDPAYPLIELATAALAVLLVKRFGFDWQAASAFVLAATLLALGLIDATTGLLPDMLTLPLLWTGLLVNAADSFVAPGTALIGAITGYALLWGASHAFRRLTGKDGFAPGDFKLLAAIGAWLGWHALPHVLLLATVTGTALGLVALGSHSPHRARAFAFGPFLTLAALFCLLLPAPPLS